jgi:hypothetical protein
MIGRPPCSYAVTVRLGATNGIVAIALRAIEGIAAVSLRAADFGITIHATLSAHEHPNGQTLAPIARSVKGGFQNMNTALMNPATSVLTRPLNES